MSVELKLCPFCGGTAHIEQPGTRRQSCVVECDSCGIRHESGDEGAVCGTAWNRREGEAARIQQQALEYVSLQAQCDEHLARIAELEREKDEAEKHAAVVSSENFDLEARIAELDRKHKEAWDDCGELNTANHELLAACGEKDRRIAELEKERDALKADAERYEYLLDCDVEAARRYLPSLDADEFKNVRRARHSVALQAEKEKRS